MESEDLIKNAKVKMLAKIWTDRSERCETKGCRISVGYEHREKFWIGTAA